MNKMCPLCGSNDLAHYAMWLSGTIPVGIEGVIACRNCHYWQDMLTIEPAESIFEDGKWVILKAGKGLFENEQEKEHTVTYRNPAANSYTRRYDWSKHRM